MMNLELGHVCAYFLSLRKMFTPHHCPFLSYDHSITMKTKLFLFFSSFWDKSNFFKTSLKFISMMVAQQFMIHIPLKIRDLHAK